MKKQIAYALVHAPHGTYRQARVRIDGDTMTVMDAQSGDELDQVTGEVGPYVDQRGRRFGSTTQVTTVDGDVWTARKQCSCKGKATSYEEA